MGILSLCFCVFPGGRRPPSTAPRTYVLSPKTCASMCDFRTYVQTLTSQSSSPPQKRTTITHHCRFLFQTPKHQITLLAIVPSVWKRFMQKIPSRYSTSSPSVYYRKSGEGKIIVWHRAIICSCVTLTWWVFLA